MSRSHLIWAASLLLALAPSCGRGQAAAGSALTPSYRSGSALSRIPSGQEWVQLDAQLENRSDGAITLESITIDGEGMGSVVEVESIEVAPIPRDTSLLTFTPGGVFRTYPPAMRIRKGVCRVQTLRPVRGFLMPQGAAAWVTILQRAVGQGRFRYGGFTVTYHQDGETYEQFMPVGERGSVVVGGAPKPPLADDQRACATYARLLPPLED